MTTISGDIYNSAAGKAASKKSDNLGQADFLKLMTEQLKHQDPMKPMENSEFLGQLAQFSTVQGINNMQDTMKGLSESLMGDQVLRGAALVGHEVLVPSKKLALDDQHPVQGSVAASAHGIVNFEIKDGNGTLINTITAKAEAAGEVTFSWDGKDANGKRMKPGEYSITATQNTTAEGKKSELSTYVNARVESVNIGSDGLYLNLKGLGSAPIGHVLRVS